MARWTALFVGFWAAAGVALEAAPRKGGSIPSIPASSTAWLNGNGGQISGPIPDGVQAGYNPSQQDRILNLLRPARVDEAVLTPDGRHVAYVADDSYRVQLVIIDLDHPETPANVEIGQGNWWQRMTGAKWNAPQVNYLHWANNQRLVFSEANNGIYAVDADGRRLTRLVSPLDVGVLKGQDATVLQPDAPPGMAIAPNQLDLMPGSPTTNTDPMLKVAPTAPTGPTVSTPASSHDLDTADPRSNSYIGVAFNGDRAIEGDTGPNSPTEVLPRNPRVVATPADDPGHLIVEASGVQNPLSGLYPYGLYRVDIETGARKSLGEADLPGHEALYDQAGHLRVVLGAVGGTYLHVFPGKSIWRGVKPLNKVVRNPADRGFEAKPETYFGGRSIPIGFDYDPNILYFASNLGRDTFGLYALNLTTGQRTPFAVDRPDFDVVNARPEEDSAFSGTIEDPLVFDAHRRQLVGVRLAGTEPSTRWLDPELGQVQGQIEQKFPERSVELLQWDDNRTRFLALVTGRSDPGRFYVYTPASDQIVLCARRDPWVSSEAVSRSAAVAFTTATGELLTGSLTLPRAPRIHPPPLVVLCPDGPGQALPPEFDPEAQAFAGMGFLVLRVNYRGSGGLGLKHLEAIRGGIDQVPLDDILATIDAVDKQVPIDAKRIAVVGEGLGGYLALRAMQVHPERFRCAVAIRAPVDLRQWVRESDLYVRAQTRSDDATAFQNISTIQQANPFTPLDALHATAPPPTPPSEDPIGLFLAKARLAFFGNDRRALDAISPIRDPQDLNRPMLLIQDGLSDEVYLNQAETLRKAVDKRGGHVELLTVSGRLADMSAPDRAKVLAHVEDFLNLDFYSYSVEIGDVKTKD